MKNIFAQVLNKWKKNKVYRSWGWYRVLDDQAGYKVKELVIEPGKSLSMQRHFKRSEHWYVLKGSCVVETEYLGERHTRKLIKNTGYVIGTEVWHKGINPTDEPCHILEVQYGDLCIEEDIERR